MANRIELPFGGLSNKVNEHRVQLGKCYDMSNVVIDRGVLEVYRRNTILSNRTGHHSGDVCWGFCHGKYSCNDVYKIVQSGGPATTGTYTITVTLNGSTQTTTAIKYGADADTVRLALEALSNVAVGELKVYGGPLPEPMYIEAVGNSVRTAIGALTVTSSVSPGSYSASRYTVAGDNEIFLVVLQENGDTSATLYTVDVSSGTWTDKGKTLHASDWYFAQYRDRIYAVNEKEGFHYYRIGAVSGYEWDDNASSSSSSGDPQSAPNAECVKQDPVSCIPASSTLALGGTWPSGTTVTQIGNQISIRTGGFINASTGLYVDVTLESTIDLSLKNYFTSDITVTTDVAQATSAISATVYMPIGAYVKPATGVSFYDNNTNDMYEIRKQGTNSITSGTFTISVTYKSSTQTTAAIPYNATHQQIYDYLVALSNIDDGEIAVTGGPLPNSSIIVELLSPSSGKVTFSAFTVTDNTTPGNIEAVAYTKWTQMVAGTGYSSGTVGTNGFVSPDLPSKRVAIKKFRIYLGTFKIGTGNYLTLTLDALANWMFDSQPYKLDFTCVAPSNTRVQYAVSYYKTSEGRQSQLSPTTQVINGAGLWQAANPVTTYDTNCGGAIKLSAQGNPKLSSSDKVYFWRREYLTGKWRLLPNPDGSYGVANPSSQIATYIDTFQEHHLANFPEPNPGAQALAGMLGQTAVCTFKGSLIVGGDRKVWISYQGEPGTFAPDPETGDLSGLDINDPYESRTLFMSQTRSERVMGIVGDDALYAVGNCASYASLGDTPQDMTPFRMLPDTRPALSSRGFCAHLGGAVLAAYDGLWIYRAVRQASNLTEGNTLSQNLFDDQRTSWSDFVGDDGSGIVVVGWNDRIWAFNGSKYMTYQAGAEVASGEWQNVNVKHAIAHPTNGVYVIDANGTIYRIEESATSDNGADVPWSYTTGVLVTDRAYLSAIEIHAEGEPSVLLEYFDTTSNPPEWKSVTIETTKGNLPLRTNIRSKPSSRHRITISGQSSRDKVYAMFLTVEQAERSQQG